MAINKNHPFEEIDGIRCSVVETGLSPERLGFLKDLLDHNGYTTVVVTDPPPKAKPAPADPGALAASPPPPPPQTFTLAVTDTTFNATNAVFGRRLHTVDGHVVTRAYWMQEEKSSHDDVPYYEAGK